QDGRQQITAPSDHAAPPLGLATIDVPVSAGQGPLSWESNLYQLEPRPAAPIKEGAAKGAASRPKIRAAEIAGKRRRYPSPASRFRFIVNHLLRRYNS